MTAPTEDLIELIERRIGQEFDDEAHLTEVEARSIAQALRSLQAEVDAAAAWVKELSDELASEIEGRYDCLLPQLQHRFDRDMTTVEDARAFLAARSALNTGSGEG